MKSGGANNKRTTHHSRRASEPRPDAGCRRDVPRVPMHKLVIGPREPCDTYPSKAPTPPKVVATGLDGLTLVGHHPIKDEVVRYLFHLRDRARRKYLPEHRGKILDHTVVVPASGGESQVLAQFKFGKLVLYRVPGTPRGNFQLQVASEYLWKHGNREALRRVLEFVEFSAEMPRQLHLTVSCLHVAVDVQGFSPPGPQDRRWITDARDRRCFLAWTRTQTMYFGCGDVLVRIYDKTCLIEHKPETAWIRQVWKQNGGDPSEQTWRVEVQLRREALVEERFGIDRLTSPEDITGRLGPIWKYMTTDWLRLVIAKLKSRRGRTRVDPAWKELSQARFDRSVPAAIPTRKGRKLETIIRTMVALLGELADVRGGLGGEAALAEFAAAFRAGEKLHPQFDEKVRARRARRHMPRSD